MSSSGDASPPTPLPYSAHLFPNTLQLHGVQSLVRAEGRLPVLPEWLEPLSSL